MTADALDELIAISGGVPATLNRLFETAIASTSEGGHGQVDLTIIREAGVKSRIPPPAGAGRLARVLQLAAAGALLLVGGWIAGQRSRQPVPSAPNPASVRPAPDPRATSGPSVTPATIPAASAAVTPSEAFPPAPASTPEQADRGVTRPEPAVHEVPRRAEDTDATYASLHENVERQAAILASRGDVKALLALQAQTANRDRQLGASCPALIAKLLEELDAKIEEARMVRLRLDGEALRPRE